YARLAARYAWDRIATAATILEAVCSASHLRGTAVVFGPVVSAEVESMAQGTNGSQMRSTSPFDMPVRSTSATTAKMLPTRRPIRRSRIRVTATATAGPVAIANTARFATTK